MSVITQFDSIFQEIFDDPQLALTPETSPNEIADWDSVAQVKLVLAIEEAFAIRFTSDEISSLRSVGDFMAAVARQKGSFA